MSLDVPESGLTPTQLARLAHFSREVADALDEALATGGSGGAVYDVTDPTYGAVGDDASNATGGIQAAIDAAHEAGGGTAYLPNGTYLVSGGAAALAGCIELKANVRLVGESRAGVILKLAADQAAFTRVLSCSSHDDVVIESLTINGNKSNQSAPEEHMSGLFIADTTRFVVRDCTFIDCVGDGISIWQNNVDSLFDNCLVTDCGRDGVSMTGSGQKRVTMRKCQFIGNAVQQVDMEAPDGPFEDVTIDDCYIESVEGSDIAAALSGQEEDKQVRGIKFVNNVVVGPTVVRWAEDVDFSNNKCSTRAGDPAPVLAIDGIVERSEFIGNTFIANHTADATNVVITGRGLGDTPTGITFAFNTVHSTLGHFGLTIAGADSVSAYGNTITTDALTFGDAHGISVRSNFSGETMSRVELRDNYVGGFFTKGIVAWGRNDVATGYIAEFICTGNTIKGTASTWAFNFDDDAAGAVLRATIYGNQHRDCYGMVEAWPQCEVLIGGNRGAGGIYSVNGTPLGAVTDAIGSTAFRRDGGAATTFYVKESETTPGTQDATGWTAK